MGPVKAEWFYSNEDEKIKLNWFCYEVALEYYDAICAYPALETYRKRHSPKMIAKFCAYFAKRMKKSIFERLAGETDATIIDEEYIADFYPKNTQKQNVLLMDAAGIAWDSLLSVCEICPSRCLSERFNRSDHFDSYDEDGLL
jgi:uncharacterized Fe-S radical SAM superfamily protein PflX